MRYFFTMNKFSLGHILKAAKNLPLYKDKLNWVNNSVELESMDLESLPFTTREDIKKAFAENTDGGFDISRAALAHLTPSPGGWMPEYLSLNDLTRQAEGTAELFRRLGVGVGSRVMSTFGYHVFAGGWLFHEAAQRAGALVLPHGPGEAARAAEIATAHQFDVLISNPTFALKIAEAGGRFKLLIAAGEPFSSVPGYRERVEAAIGGKAIDVFGMSETGLVAAETLAQNGLEPLPTMAILEVIDPETLAPTANGEKGELVITTLARELMPLIRFRTGDLCVVERLPDGNIRLPRGVIGRTDEMVKVKGVKLYAKEFGPLLASVPGLDAKQFQVRVSRNNSGTDNLTLKVVGEKNTDISSLDNIFRQRLGIGVNNLEIVETINGPMLIDERLNAEPMNGQR